MNPFRATFLAVFVVSLSTLAFEVLLARIFSITQWNHLSFMVISIALFGFAASGTLLGLIAGKPGRLANRLIAPDAVPWLIGSFSLFTVTALFILVRLPMDYFLIPVLGIFCTALSFGLFVKSLKFLKAKTVALIMCLEPLYGIILAIVLIHEIPARQTVIGGIIILAAVTIESLLQGRQSTGVHQKL